MSKQSDYTPEEWKAITAAPMLAGLVVSVSDLSGPVGTLKEAFAVAKAVAETATNTSSELIRILAEGMKTWSGRPDIPELPKDQEGARAALINSCKQAVDVVAQKSTAEAAKEGGFLGIGGTRVSEAETTALKDLAATLGVSV